MNINITMKKTHYREIWISHFGEIPKDKFGRSYEIHHIDGDHNNDDITNLKLVSINEHYDIHYRQGDFGACQLIASRISSYLSPCEKSELMKLENNKRIKNGTHNWQGQNNYRHAQIANGTDHMMGAKNPVHKRVVNGTHNFLGEISPNLIRVSCLSCRREVNLPTYFGIHGDKCNKGRNIYRLDSTVYTFENKNTGQIINMTQSDLITTFGLKQQNLNAVVRGKKKSCSGWRLKI